MSYYPANASAANMTYSAMGCFSTRLDMSTDFVQDTSTYKHYTSNFTNPAVGGSVSITLTNPDSKPIRVGDHAVIGTRACIVRTPATISTTSTYQLTRMAGYEAGTDLTTRTLYISDPDNSANVTTATMSAVLVDARNGDSQSLTIPAGNTSKVPTNSYVSVGDHTGTYVVTAVTSNTSITVMKIAEGDVPAGVSITSSPSISTGKLLAVIPRKPFLMQFVPVEMWSCCLKNSNASTNTLLLGMGWNSNSTGGTARSAFSDNLGWGGSSATYGVPTGASAATAGEYGLLRDVSASSQNLRRLAVPAGHALMAIVATKTSSGTNPYVLDVFVRGFYARIPTIGT